MAMLKPATLLFQVGKKSLVQHTVKRGFLFSWKKGVSRDLIIWLQQPIDLSPTGVRRWLRKKEWEALVADHRYLPERHHTLGPDLATAHFVVARGGAVRFEGVERWISTNAAGKSYLPSSAQANIKLEAVDVSNTKMMYSSFDNFVDLHHLKYLNVSNCPHINDWCLDRFVNFRQTLLALDLSGCPEVTERGLASLHRLHNLKRLFLYDMPNVKNQKMVALMLEEAMPKCVIEGIDYTSGTDLEEESADGGDTPPFLRQWEDFAHSKEHERTLAAASDGVLELTNAANEKRRTKIQS